MAVPVLNGKTQFFDAAGVSLALGSVSLYVPGTTTPKQTWQDEAKTILNTTPTISLDAGGYAMIYGNGGYRQIVKDLLGNTIWDQVAWANDPDDAAAAAVAAFAAELADTEGASLVGLGSGTVEDITGVGGAALIGSRTGDVQDVLDSNWTNLIAGAQMQRKCSVMILGDSILEGSEASIYTNSYGNMFARSVLNANNQGYPVSAGYGFHTVLNMANAALEANWTTTGTASATGFLGSRLSLAAGQYIEITGRQFTDLDAIYDGALSTGSLLFKLNGTTVATKAVSGSTLNNTFPTPIKDGDNTLTTDVMRIEASGGTIVLCGVFMLRSAQGVPLVYVAAKSGTAYQDYTGSTAMDEIAYYLKALGNDGASQVMVYALGTNNIYNTGKSLSPAATVSALQTLIAGINSRVGGNVLHVIQVPPRSNESLFPVIQPDTTYNDYVEALVAFASANHYGIIRQDLSPITTDTGLLNDGLHPGTRGHFAMGQILVRSFNLPLNTDYTFLGPDTLRGSATYDPPSLAAGTSTTTAIGCPGANMGDFVQVSFSIDVHGITITGQVTSDDLVTVTFFNGTAGTLDIGSGTLRVLVTQA